MRIQGLTWILLISMSGILFVAGVSSRCLDDQRMLLLQLKGSLVFDSSYSTKLVKWNQSGDDCCKWDGVACDGEGHVITLNLESESISEGPENLTALFGFRYLERLNLAFNLFKGDPIPKGLQNLTSLTYLNLSNAGFGGQVPFELSTLTSLEVLDLSTLFIGDQPLKLENPNLDMLLQNLSGLRELYLDYVDISDQESDWCQTLSSSLPNLRNLSLRGCGISGPLDSSLAELQSLSILQLDRNNLSTTVPGFFAKFSNLTALTLASCFLQGTFPDTIFQVPTLQTLDLTDNKQLSGTIPQFPVNSSLRIMSLSYTNFSGLLPKTISNLRTLLKIDLSNCNFAGVIPSTISNLTELVHIDFSFNSFNGSIPLFSESRKLEYIDLSSNSLTGLLSRLHLEGLSSLAIINLGNNFLSGTIPTSLFGLPSLQKLQLSNNRFSGWIDEFSLPNRSVLDVLDLSGNQLQGSIPAAFFKLEHLNVLVLSWNLFNGTVELEKVRNFPNITRLELGYNKLSVDISNGNSSLSQYPFLSRLNLASCNLYNFPDLRNQSRLTFLDLSSNNITGEVPKWIWDIGDGSLTHLNLSRNLLVGFKKPFNFPPFLAVLDLHSNSLRGEIMLPPSATYVDYSTNKFEQEIPVEIENIISFALFFSLANNSFSGTIPAFLCNAAYLQVLDLSNNLSGSIPSCLVKSPSLAVLNLRRNKISGDIPDEFPSSCGLKTIDLSQNMLGGKVPRSMANCTSLEVLNVGNNNIEDTFPCRLKSSSFLRVLVLRGNRFYGDIRCSEVSGSWTNLQIIDIASNNFSGELNPACISTWRGMMLENGTQSTGDHIHYEFLILGNLYYQDAVTVTIKGLELELVKILTVFTSVDISNNSFTGVIPETIGDLSSLYVLNLSHNSFSGEIPSSIGNLKQLGSLDLSMNQLTGRIPKELASLNFLSFLNLSYNKLDGKIPTGSQFQTFGKESFAGNPGLCGFPLNLSCASELPSTNQKRRSINIDFNWKFIITGLGYGVGASLILAPLVFCKQWREMCDEQVDHCLKLIYPRYGFSYVRYDSKVEAIENYRDDMTDDDDDDDDGDVGYSIQRGRYCIFCTKLDAQIKSAIHSPRCTCHLSPPKCSPTSSSSSSSLLVVYR